MTTPTIFAGDTHTVKATITENGSPVSLVGATLQLKLSTSATATTALVTKETVDFTVNSNVATCELSSTDTEQTPGIYYLEIKVIDAANRERKQSSYIEIKPSTT